MIRLEDDIVLGASKPRLLRASAPTTISPVGGKDTTDGKMHCDLPSKRTTVELAAATVLLVPRSIPRERICEAC